MKHAELAQKTLKKKPKKKKGPVAAKNQINNEPAIIEAAEQIVSSDSGIEKYDLRKPPFSISDGGSYYFLH